ncbi:hypothetical protein ANN_28915 [Periplaneta americana]|uniref:Uncharacterized protein n=1 Tax=Periplaneta americana TaxID=6978 RepID=A0ABQ8S971_PERAM|nr:hypothetical protein ANN_28915 [Periplaneta americana]
MQEVMLLTYDIVNGCTNAQIEKEYFFGDHTITDWRQFIDEVVEVNSEKVVGDGKVVEIDESKFGRRKYNRDHFVGGQWVLEEWKGIAEMLFSSST